MSHSQSKQGLRLFRKRIKSDAAEEHVDIGLDVVLSALPGEESMRTSLLMPELSSRFSFLRCVSPEEPVTSIQQSKALEGSSIIEECEEMLRSPAKHVSSGDGLFMSNREEDRLRLKKKASHSNTRSMRYNKFSTMNRSTSSVTLTSSFRQSDSSCSTSVTTPLSPPYPVSSLASPSFFDEYEKHMSRDSDRVISSEKQEERRDQLQSTGRQESNPPRKVAEPFNCARREESTEQITSIVSCGGIDASQRQITCSKLANDEREATNKIEILSRQNTLMSDSPALEAGTFNLSQIRAHLRQPSAVPSIGAGKELGLPTSFENEPSKHNYEHESERLIAVHGINDDRAKAWSTLQPRQLRMSFDVPFKNVDLLGMAIAARNSSIAHGKSSIRLGERHPHGCGAEAMNGKSLSSQSVESKHRSTISTTAYADSLKSVNPIPNALQRIAELESMESSHKNMLDSINACLRKPVGSDQKSKDIVNKFEICNDARTEQNLGMDASKTYLTPSRPTCSLTRSSTSQSEEENTEPFAVSLRLRPRSPFPSTTRSPISSVHSHRSDIDLEHLTARPVQPGLKERINKMLDRNLGHEAVESKKTDSGQSVGSFEDRVNALKDCSKNDRLRSGSRLPNLIQRRLQTSEQKQKQIVASKIPLDTPDFEDVKRWTTHSTETKNNHIAPGQSVFRVAEIFESVITPVSSDTAEEQKTRDPKLRMTTRPESMTMAEDDTTFMLDDRMLGMDTKPLTPVSPKFPDVIEAQLSPFLKEAFKSEDYKESISKAFDSPSSTESLWTLGMHKFRFQNNDSCSHQQFDDFVQGLPTNHSSVALQSLTNDHEEHVASRAGPKEDVIYNLTSKEHKHKHDSRQLRLDDLVYPEKDRDPCALHEGDENSVADFVGVASSRSTSSASYYPSELRHFDKIQGDARQDRFNNTGCASSVVGRVRAHSSASQMAPSQRRADLGRRESVPTRMRNNSFAPAIETLPEEQKLSFDLPFSQRSGAPDRPVSISSIRSFHLPLQSRPAAPISLSTPNALAHVSSFSNQFPQYNATKSLSKLKVSKKLISSPTLLATSCYIPTTNIRRDSEPIINDKGRKGLFQFLKHNKSAHKNSCSLTAEDAHHKSRSEVKSPSRSLFARPKSARPLKRSTSEPEFAVEYRKRKSESVFIPAVPTIDAGPEASGRHTAQYFRTNSSFSQYSMAI